MKTDTDSALSTAPTWYPVLCSLCKELKFPLHIVLAFYNVELTSELPIASHHTVI